MDPEDVDGRMAAEGPVRDLSWMVEESRWPATRVRL
jgi:hypothetical protein